MAAILEVNVLTITLLLSLCDNDTNWELSIFVYYKYNIEAYSSRIDDVFTEIFCVFEQRQMEILAMRMWSWLRTNVPSFP